MTDTKHPLDTPWHGTPVAQPADWDGDTETLVYRGGFHYRDYSVTRWDYGRNRRDANYDIIQYRRKSDALPEPTWGYKIADNKAGPLRGATGWESYNRTRTAFARYIEAHEPAPVDPDEALAERIYRDWLSSSADLSFKVFILRAIKAAREQS